MPQAATSRVSSRELIAVAGFTLLALVVRFWAYGRVGLQHFDEGVYAMSALWSAQPGGLAGLDPDALSYAPPGYLLLTGCVMLVLGFLDQPVILVSTLAGVASVPLSAALAHRVLGPGVAVATAALAALSGPHIVFSRMALTDSLFLFGWLAALLVGAWFLEKPRLLRAICLGLAVGLAQNLKYNGALVGLVVALAALPGLVKDRSLDRAQLGRLAMMGILAVAVALLVYWPWYRFVENHGGYQRLLAHHRSYVDGFGAWPANLRTQLAQAVALSGGWPWLLSAWLLAAASAAWVEAGQPSSSTPRSRWPALAAALALSGLALVALPELPWWLGLIAFPRYAFSKNPGIRLIAAWWLFMSLLVPLYHPYARLALPLNAVGWILTAHFLVEGVLRRPSTHATLGVSRAWLAWVLLVLLAACSNHFLIQRPRPLPALLGSTSMLRDGLASHLKTPQQPRQGVLLMLTRPATTFYLGIWNVSSFAFYDRLDWMLEVAQPEDWLLIDELQLRQEPDPEAALARVLENWELVPEGSWQERLGPGTVLDLDPEAAYGDRSSTIIRWWLLRKKPATASAPSLRPDAPREPSPR